MPSVAKINTFWVSAKPSIDCRKIRLCINSGLHVFRQLTGAVKSSVLCSDHFTTSESLIRFFCCGYLRCSCHRGYQIIWEGSEPAQTNATFHYSNKCHFCQLVLSWLTPLLHHHGQHHRFVAAAESICNIKRLNHLHPKTQMTRFETEIFSSFVVNRS